METPNMSGGMQDSPLQVWKLIDHAARVHGTREIVTRTTEGPIHRCTWQDVHGRAKRVAQALLRLGIRKGDRVATLAWNTYRHVECLYGISGIGAVAHTINPRLFRDQIVYIANHAEDRVLLFDLSFTPLVEEIAPQLKTVERFIVLTDHAHMPVSALDLSCYEELIASADGDLQWIEVEETAPAGLCYTSGTTGKPKGVLYTHRSNILHTLATAQPDVFDMSCRSCVLPVVPMFHANGWGVPFTAAAVGAKLVLAGPCFDAPTLHRLIIEEGVTLALGVPTVWLGLLEHLRRTGERLGKLERVIIGGAAAPRSMIEAFESNYGINVLHAWGMTELSPLGTVGAMSARAEALPQQERIDLKCSQGRAPFGIELSIRDDEGRELPWDGKSRGHLYTRGPWTVKRYFKDESTSAVTSDGWFHTGDVATIDPEGYMRIVDRSKDVIKSGGEWISSIELENEAVGHPAVTEAAVIGMPHPKWGERPVLIVVTKQGATVSKQEILNYLSGRIAKWWMPDDVLFVDEIPHTATGKISKATLRERLKDYVLPTAR